jgi:hypothetical protein
MLTFASRIVDIVKNTLRACAGLHDMIGFFAPRIAQPISDTLLHRSVLRI